MKRNLTELKRAIRPKTNSIRTTFLDLLKVTRDGVLVVAAFERMRFRGSVLGADELQEVRLGIGSGSRT
jgi:hypothetical protein